jgi:hypothetical protein
MADPVSILISLAPFILDLLFGGEGMKHQKINPIDNKMDPAFLISGHGYPKRKQFANDKEFNEAYAKEYAKYALKSATNPWVLFLEKKGFYDFLKEALGKLREEYEQLKKEAGIEEPVRKGQHSARTTKALAAKKAKQLDKFNTAKYIIQQTADPHPNPIQEEFLNLVKKEHERALKMVFSNQDISKIYDRIIIKLARTIQNTESELKEYVSQPVAEPKPQTREVEMQGSGRVSYKAIAKELARKHGFRLPKSARQHGKTWKQIYLELISGLK